MKWDELTPEAQDLLVAQRVMNWQPQECDGEMGEVSGGWFCTRCGLEGDWTDAGFNKYSGHVQLPPRYTQSMDAAWKVVEKMLERQEKEHYFQHFVWKGPQFKPSFDYLTNEGYPLDTTCWYVYLCVHDRCRFVCAKTPQEAVCRAALLAAGAITPEGEIVEVQG